jgi:hypothetical protein
MTGNAPTLAATADDAPRVAAPAARAGLLAGLWLAGFGALAVALVRLYPDSYQQDGGFHFIFARWAFAHPHLFVDVWGRPLFTLLYAGPAQLGYPAAKLVTVAVAVATGWHTYRLARELELPRPALAVPLLFLQPAFLLLSSETMTEPLFALLLVVALRLHVAGRIRAGMAVASLLPLARPEGFFVGVLWGAAILAQGRAGPTLPRRALSALWLALGTFLWWLAALLMTGDPLFIPHVWPAGWGATSAANGTGPLLHYVAIRHQILAGPVLEGLFLAGLVALALRRRFALVVGPVVLVVALHAVFFVYGLFGSAGYARYLVCVAPPMALATLAGWDLAARWLAWLPRALTFTLGALVLAAALVHCVLSLDRFGSSRDALAVDHTVAWLREHPRPIRQLVFSQAYMTIALGRDPAGRPALGRDVEQNVRILRATPPGTLAFWDAHTGPLFHAIGPHELLRAGFQHVYSESYNLSPRFPAARLYPLRWLIPAADWPYPYRQELYLLYKPLP